MSAWIVDKDCIDRIVTFCLNEPRLAKQIFKVDFEGDPEEKDSTLNKVGRKLWEMNHKAVEYRYDDKLNRKDVKAYVWGYKTATIHQVLKSIHCLAYQCCEGKVPNSRLYKQLGRLGDCVAEKIARETEGYEKAVWG